MKVEDVEIEIVDIYICGHVMKSNRDNQTAELLRRTTWGWAANGRLRDIFKGDIPNSLKRRAFNYSVLPVLAYSVETLTLTRTSPRHRVRNEEIRRRSGIVDIIDHIAKLNWVWAGHVVRLKDNSYTEKILNWRPRVDKCNRGRPPSRWTDDIKMIYTN